MNKRRLIELNVASGNKNYKMFLTYYFRKGQGTGIIDHEYQNSLPLHIKALAHSLHIDTHGGKIYSEELKEEFSFQTLYLKNKLVQ